MQSVETLYIILTNQYGHANQKLIDSTSSLFDALVTVIELDDPDTKIELLDAFRDVWKVSDLSYRTSLIPVVKTLNNYVIGNTEFDNINEFLDETGIQVSNGWAALSEAAGTPIDPLFVQ